MVHGLGSDDSLHKPIGRLSVISYGVGHMLNDMTSACWFTYLLVFITDIGLSPRYVLETLVMYFRMIYFSMSLLPIILFTAVNA